MRVQASLALAASLLAAHSTWAATVLEPPTPTRLAQLPIEFEVNEGQHHEAIRFLARAQGYQMYLTDEGAVISVEGKTDKEFAQSHILLRFGGSARAPELVAQGKSGHRTNYFTGDPSSFRTDVPNYERVLYRQIYPGVDVVFYGKNGAIEYDLLLQPGANPDPIEFDFSGARGLEVNGQGDLLIRSEAGVLTQHRPIVFQDKDGKRQSVSADYTIVDGTKVRLRLGAFDPSETLVIDPVLSYSTFVGSTSGADNAIGLAVDASGSAYIAGYSTATNWPTVGAYQTTRLGSSYDAVIAKLNPQGTGLVYSTYLGVRRTDTLAMGIAVDATGNAYVLGFTGASGFPTTSGAYRATGTGGLFVTKLNPAGNALVYSTYLQASWITTDAGFIRVDGAGNAIVAGGLTSGGVIPTTTGVVQATPPADINSTNAYILKLNSAGSNLVFGTYLGGSSDNEIHDLTTDSAGNIYVTGRTLSTNFPVTPGAYQTMSNGSYDAFVSKINPTGTTLLLSSYIGGSRNDSGNGIAVDSNGRMYLTGETASANFPIVNASRWASGNYGVGFITVMNPDGASLRWSSYFGGRACLSDTVFSCVPSDPVDGGTAIAVDSTGTNMFVAGYVSSIQVYDLVDPIQTSLGGRMDAYVAQLVSNPFTGIFSIRYATRLGGASRGYVSNVLAPNQWNEQVNRLAIDPQGNAYVSGTTTSADFPTTKGSFKLTTASTQSGFVSKLSTLNVPVTLQVFQCGDQLSNTQLVAFTALNAAGNMVFMDGATTLATAPIVGGMASWSGQLAVGVHKFTATRSSDGALSTPMYCAVDQ